MSKIGIIMQREFNQRVRKRSFIITTIFMPLLMVALIMAPVIIATSSKSSEKSKERTIIVEDNSGIIAGRLSDAGNLRFREADKSAEEIKPTLGKTAYGLLVIGNDVVSNPSNIQLYTKETPGADMESRIASQIKSIIEAEKASKYDIESIREIIKDINTRVSISSFKIEDSGAAKANVGGVSMSFAYIFSLLTYLFVFIYGSMVMHGVVEEKTSRVMEIMVSSVKPFQLMLGKILGIASVALTQFLIWIVLILVLGSAAIYIFVPELSEILRMPADAMQASGGLNLKSMQALRMATDGSYILGLLGGFIIFFIGGYLLYAAMFAAIGSAVDNTADLQQLQMPISLPLVIAIISMMPVMRDPNSDMAFWLSMIPFTSPIIMMARIPYGVPLWEVALSALILYASFIFVVWFAGKVYRVGIFMYGKKPSWADLIKWAKYK